MQLRDHLVELRLATVPKNQGIDVAAHRAALKQAFGESFVGSCEAKLTVPELECGLRARNVAGATACAGK